MNSEKFSYTCATSASSISESAFRSSSGYYTYASPPRAVHGRIRRYRNNISRPRGAHDYYNMMYDPHIFRGRATIVPQNTKSKTGESENESKISEETGGANSENKYRKKRQSQYGSVPGNGLSRSRYKITTRVTTRTKGLTKGLGREERQHTHVQTNQFLEDLDGDLSAEERDAVVQTDAIYNTEIKKRSHTNNPKYVAIKNGVDACTQVLPGELCEFDDHIQPIIETFVGKILQQALLETMEEEEITALREQQRHFLEKRKQEEKLLRQLQEDQERITEKKERLRSEMKREDNTVEDMSLHDRVILDQAIRNASINQPNIPTSYLIELLPSVLNSLRQEGYLSDTVGDDLFSTFVPMWQSSSKAESEVEDQQIVESSGSLSVDPEVELAKHNTTTESRQEEIFTDNSEASEEENFGVNDCQEIRPDGGNDDPLVMEQFDNIDIDSSFHSADPINKLQNGGLKSFERIDGSVIQGGIQ